MRLEDIKQDFPQMPREIRMMVEQEVKKQINTAAPGGRRRKHRVRRAAAISLAAAMLLGTTAFAGIYYRMHNEPVGEYAVRTIIEEEESSSLQEQAQEILEIPDITMEVSYLPEGMVEAEEGKEGKYCYADSMYKGGILISLYKMDNGDAQFDMLTTNVVGYEEIKAGTYDGVYLKLAGAGEGEISFDQRIYVAYTDVHYVMAMYAASDVSKEEALKIAGGVHLLPAADANAQGIVQAYNWSDYLKDQASQDEESYEGNPSLSVPISAMSNTHTIGEAFATDPFGEEEDWLGLKKIEVKVTDVQVYDNISPLDLSVIDSGFREELLKETDQEGKLLPTRIDYVKYGDGIHSIDEVVNSREVPQKLVYVTVEYTNTGAEEVTELLFSGKLMKFREENGRMNIYDGRTVDTGSEWDDAVLEGVAFYVEMWYYDVHGGEQHINYIEHLKAGETATVHMAWMVPEEELENLYLNLDTFGSAYEFCETSLTVGYVDIRQ